MSVEGKKLILGLSAGEQESDRKKLPEMSRSCQSVLWGWLPQQQPPSPQYYVFHFICNWAVSFKAKFQRAWQSACFLRAQSHCISRPTHAASAPETWTKAVWLVVWFLCKKTQQKILLAEGPKKRLSYEQQYCGLTFELSPWCKTLVIILFTSISSNQSATNWTINNICRKLIAETRMSNIMGSCAHQQCIPQDVSKMPHGLRVSIRLSN